MKPSRQGKYRQVEEFLRILDASISDALDKGHLRTPTAERAAADRRPRLRQRLPDLRHRALPHPRARAAGAPDRHRPARAVARRTTSGIAARARRRRDVRRLVHRRRRARPYAPDVVLALHACDTATDDALARAIEWEAPLVLAAPCCHHDIAAQLRTAPTPAPYAMLTRHGILRERFADTLTDGLRASLLRLEGYRVDVMQFVGSEHTPRNTLLRARPHRAAGHAAAPPARSTTSWSATWGVRPRLGELLGCADAPMQRSWPGSVAAPFALGVAVTPAAPQGTTVFTFDDPAIVEASALVVAGRAVPHHQRLRRHRPGVRRRPAPARTVGVTHWSDDPTDVEALAPAGPGYVWVGDIGDNAAERSSVDDRPGPGRARRPHGAPPRRTGSPTPTARPTPRPCCATRRPGGSTSPPRTSSAASCTPSPSTSTPTGDQPARRAVGRVLPVATDGAFFPDGRHLVVRDYSSAVVYAWPSLQPVGLVRRCPPSDRARGSRSAADGTVYSPPRGSTSPVLEVTLPAEGRGEAAPPGRRRARRPVAPAATAADPRRPVRRRAGVARRLAVAGRRPARARRRARRPRCARCARADATSTAPSIGVRTAARRLTSVTGMARLRTELTRRPGLDPAPGGQGLRLPRRARARGCRAEDVERVKGLVIPPAWQDVWICPWPNGHLQAVGTDDAGRRQYLYHPDWRAPARRRQARAGARVRPGAVEGARAGAGRPRHRGDEPGPGLRGRRTAARPRLLPDRQRRVRRRERQLRADHAAAPARAQAGLDAGLLLRREVRDRALHHHRRPRHRRGARGDAPASRAGRRGAAGVEGARSLARPRLRPRQRLRPRGRRGSRRPPRTSAPGTRPCSRRPRWPRPTSPGTPRPRASGRRWRR